MRRCTACTETGREMRAHDVAPAADAVDVAEAAAALPSQGPLLDSLAALGVSSGGSEDSSMMPASLRELELPPLDDRMEREVFAPGSDRAQTALEIYRGEYGWTSDDRHESTVLICHVRGRPPFDTMKAVLNVAWMAADNAAGGELLQQHLDGPGVRTEGDPMRLTNRQADLLMTRGLHLAFCELSSVHLDENMINAIWGHLRAIYVNKKQWGNFTHLAYHAALRIRPGYQGLNDVAPWLHRGHRFNDLGEGLEAFGRFEDAADAYIAGAHSFGELQPLRGQSPLWGNAAIALKRAAKESGEPALWARAEECLLNSVHAGGIQKLSNVWDFYNSGVAWGTVPRDLAYVFGGLVSIAEHRFDGDDADIISMRQSYRQIIRNDISRRRAQAILEGLPRCADVAAFRETIMACRSTRVTAYEVEGGVKRFTSSRQLAVEALVSRGKQEVVASTKHTCEECGSVSATRLKACACKRVFYCSRECQKTHWKIHREVCTARASRSG